MQPLRQFGLLRNDESEPGVLYGITRRTREILAMRTPVATTAP